MLSRSSVVGVLANSSRGRPSERTNRRVIEAVRSGQFLSKLLLYEYYHGVIECITESARMLILCGSKSEV